MDTTEEFLTYVKDRYSTQRDIKALERRMRKASKGMPLSRVESTPQAIRVRKQREPITKSSSLKLIKKATYQLKKNFGITFEDREAIKARFPGLCPICRSRAADAIDHNHKTNTMSGYICRQCNRALGLLGDSASVVERAAEYLKNPPLAGDWRKTVYGN